MDKLVVNQRRAEIQIPIRISFAHGVIIYRRMTATSCRFSVYFYYAISSEGANTSAANFTLSIAEDLLKNLFMLLSPMQRRDAVNVFECARKMKLIFIPHSLSDICDGQGSELQ